MRVSRLRALRNGSDLLRGAPWVPLAVGSVGVITGVSIARGMWMPVWLIIGALFVLLQPGPVAWTVALLGSAVAGRGIAALLGLPDTLAFAHYPLSFAFLLMSMLRASRDHRLRLVPAAKWLGVLLVLVVMGFLAAPTEPIRSVIFVTILGEPIVLIAAYQLCPPSEAEVRRISVWAAVLLAIQIPIGLAQGLANGWFDPVVGTLVGHGAGAHVLGGLFGLAIFVTYAAVRSGKMPPAVGVVAIACAYGMIIAAGAFQVLFASASALAVCTLAEARTSRDSRRRPLLRLGAAGAAIIVLLATTAIDPGIGERAVRLVRPVGLQVADEAKVRLTRDSVTFLFGSGPGAGASRASLLLTDVQRKATSPLSVFGLGPTAVAEEFASRTLAASAGGSAESFSSSAMSLLVDLGLVGLLLWLGLFLMVWKRLYASTSWLASAARPALFMTTALAFVDVWLEYPEFVVPLAILIALPLVHRGASVSEGDRPQLAVIGRSELVV